MQLNKSIKINFLYNILLKVLSIIFPLITFPYVARILSAEGIGKVDFSYSVIQYFIMISQVGIPTYAIRECARHRDNREKLTKTVQEILLINLVAVIIAYIMFFLTIYNVHKFKDYENLLILMSVNIILTSIGVEWFYQAIEEYRYITIRSICVKLFSFLLVFTLIKQRSDYVMYGLITVLSVSLNYIYNFIHINNYVSLFKKHTNYNLKQHIRPILLLFAMSLSISVYANLDKVMLGFISGDKYVGLYVAANKMVTVVLALVTSLGTVLLPRMSYYIENRQFGQVNTLIRKSIDFILMISIPSTVGLIMLAKPIILLIAGNSYIDAIITLRILSPIIIFIALSNIIGIQILVSHGKEKITLISTIVGALFNFGLNLLLIPMFQQNGSAVGTLVGEISVATTQIIFAYSFIKGNVIYKNLISYLLGSALIFVTCYLIGLINSGSIMTIFLSVFLSLGIYLGFLYLVKNYLVFELAYKLVRKFKKNKF